MSKTILSIAVFLLSLGLFIANLSIIKNREELENKVEMNTAEINQLIEEVRTNGFDERM
jgi:hypothetical protein